MNRVKYVFLAETDQNAKISNIQKRILIFSHFKIGGNLLFNNPHNLNTFLKIISKKEKV